MVIRNAVVITLVAISMFLVPVRVDAYQGPPLIVSGSRPGYLPGNSPELAIDDDTTTAATIGTSGGWYEYSFADGVSRPINGLSVQGRSRASGTVRLFDSSGAVVYETGFDRDFTVTFPEIEVLSFRFISNREEFVTLYDFQPHLVTIPPPGTPLGLRSPDATTSSVTVEWDPPTDGGPVVGYRVYRDGVVRAEVTALTFTDSTVTAGQTYHYTVSAINGSGESLLAVPLQVLVPAPEPPPGPPHGLRSGIATATGLPLTWEEPVDGGAAAGYRVYRDGVLLTQVSHLSYTDPTVITGQTYSYTVTAVNDSGESLPSAPLAVTVTVVLLPPHPPVNASVTAGSRHAALKWEPSRSGDQAESYRVVRDGSLISTTAGTSWIDRGLEPDQTYTYSLTAVNAAGESAPVELAVTTSQLGVIDGVSSSLSGLAPTVREALAILMPFFLAAAGLVLARKVLGRGLTWLVQVAGRRLGGWRTR